MRCALAMVLVCAACGSPSGPYAPKPVNPDAIRRACAMEVSCFATPPITPGGSCVSQFEYGLATGAGIFFGPSATDLQRYVDCAGSSSTCTSVLSCASHNHGPDWCTAHPNATCDGNVLVSCVGGWGLELTDCGAFGLHCGTANGASLCTDGNSCDPATMPAHCNGNRYLECDSTTRLEASIDCGALYSGGVCKSTTSGTSSTVGCYPPASGSCATDGVTCDGATAVVCESGAQLRVACGQFASHCVVDSTGKLSCVPDASNCTEASPDSCNGNAIQMCVNGNFASTACSSIGLSTCQTVGTAVRCN